MLSEVLSAGHCIHWNRTEWFEWEFRRRDWVFVDKCHLITVIEARTIIIASTIWIRASAIFWANEIAFVKIFTIFVILPCAFTLWENWITCRIQWACWFWARVLRSIICFTISTCAVRIDTVTYGWTHCFTLKTIETLIFSITITFWIEAHSVIKTSARILQSHTTNADV